MINLEKTNRLSFPDLDIDLKEGKVFRSGREIILTPIEFNLLVYLASRQGQILLSREITNAVWGVDKEVRSLDVHIYYLRRKIERLVDFPHYIVTVPDRGYRFDGAGLTYVTRDARGVPLHSETGPAAWWSDGSQIWAWHGNLVSQIIVEEPNKVTFEMIFGEPNLEVRRFMIERFGLDRLIREGHAKLVHEDSKGKLWRLSRFPRTVWGIRNEAMQVLELTNSTSEIDGSFKHYFLRVPPRIRTATSAVAWTFGIKPQEYLPAMET